jgi:glycosyltransferase involved in cell wall biosynthesis
MDEIKFPFPFHPFQTYFKSGQYFFNTVDEKNSANEGSQRWFQKLKKKIRPKFDQFLHRAGLFSAFYKIRLSDSLRNWIRDFNPDIIYVQPFHHNMMRFGNLLYHDLKIPYAIHIMDDSVTYINKSLIFRGFIQRRITNDFERLVANASIHLCISKAMADEYKRRYGKRFLHFRNPIDLGIWSQSRKKDLTCNPESLKIIYSGRTYPPYFDTLVDVCRIVDRLNTKERQIRLEISSFDVNPLFLKRIKKLKGISFFPPVPDNVFPSVISQYDIFLICADFDRAAQKYLHFSISTRASEGMISSVPVLVYAPAGSALCNYFKMTGSGYVVGENDMEKLEAGILKLWNDQECRRHISENAVRTAIADSNANVVRDEFRKALIVSNL